MSSGPVADRLKERYSSRVTDAEDQTKYLRDKQKEIKDTHTTGLSQVGTCAWGGGGGNQQSWASTTVHHVRGPSSNTARTLTCPPFPPRPTMPRRRST